MHTMTTERFSNRHEAIRIRDRAQQLLDRLSDDQRRLETSLRERGREDQLKVVTGQSAIENAIASTRALIASVDRYLASAAGINRDLHAPARSSRPHSQCAAPVGVH